MPTQRPTLPILLTAAALAFGASGCGTDDAVERDAKDAKQEVEKSGADEKAKEAGKDAGDAVEKGAEDVDGN